MLDIQCLPDCCLMQIAVLSSLCSCRTMSTSVVLCLLGLSMYRSARCNCRMPAVRDMSTLSATSMCRSSRNRRMNYHRWLLHQLGRIFQSVLRSHRMHSCQYKSSCLAGLHSSMMFVPSRMHPDCLPLKLQSR